MFNVVEYQNKLPPLITCMITALNSCCLSIVYFSSLLKLIRQIYTNTAYRVTEMPLSPLFWFSCFRKVHIQI